MHATTKESGAKLLYIFYCVLNERLLFEPYAYLSFHDRDLRNRLTAQFENQKPANSLW